MVVQNKCVPDGTLYGMAPYMHISKATERCMTVGVEPGIFRRGLKYGFQGTVNAKNLQKNRFLPSGRG